LSRLLLASEVPVSCHHLLSTRDFAVALDARLTMTGFPSRDHRMSVTFALRKSPVTAWAGFRASVNVSISSSRRLSLSCKRLGRPGQANTTEFRQKAHLKTVERNQRSLSMPPLENQFVALSEVSWSTLDAYARLVGAIMMCSL
jgi:hypothetical protein